MDYLKRGLLALSRAHRANTMAGHLGAPLVAVELLKADRPGLPAPVVAGLEAELERLLAGEEPWFSPARVGVTIDDIFAEQPLEGEPATVDPVVAALADSIGALRQSGHNVIFAALALRGLALRPEFATDELVDGLRQTINGFANAGPGRLYGADGEEWQDPRQVPLPDDSEPYTDAQDLARRTLALLIDEADVPRRALGGLHHVVNHAAALLDLHRLGHDDLARRGYPAHRDHVRWWLLAPPREEDRRPPSAEDPFTESYWSNGALLRTHALLSHRPKTIYGFSRVASVIDDSDQVAAGREALRYLM